MLLTELLTFFNLGRNGHFGGNFSINDVQFLSYFPIETKHSQVQAGPRSLLISTGDVKESAVEIKKKTVGWMDVVKIENYKIKK